MRELIYREALEYHPAVTDAPQCREGRPSALDTFRQFFGRLPKDRPALVSTGNVVAARGPAVTACDSRSEDLDPEEICSSCSLNSGSGAAAGPHSLRAHSARAARPPLQAASLPRERLRDMYASHGTRPASGYACGCEARAERSMETRNFKY